jgi:hypothetical protein
MDLGRWVTRGGGVNGVGSGSCPAADIPVCDVDLPDSATFVSWLVT